MQEIRLPRGKATARTVILKEHSAYKTLHGFLTVANPNCAIFFRAVKHFARTSTKKKKTHPYLKSNDCIGRSINWNCWT
jgi:hypothetical protein